MWNFILSGLGSFLKNILTVFTAYKSGQSSAKKDMNIQQLKDENERLKKQRDSNITSIDDAKRMWDNRRKSK